MYQFNRHARLAQGATGSAEPGPDAAVGRPSAPARQAIVSELEQIFRDVFDDPTIVLSASTSVRDIPAWDSGKMVMIILAVEERFRLTLKSREIDRLRHVGDWAGLLEARGGHG